MARTLLIIDMQPGFDSAMDERTINNIQDEVRRAKRRGAGIIVCEYRGYGKTHKEIMDVIGDYPLTTRCYKDHDDGSEQVFKAAKKNFFDLTRWRVCGVNIAYCVNETVQGLRDLLPTNTDIEVRKSACNCVLGSEQSWDRFEMCNGQAVQVM